MSNHNTVNDEEEDDLLKRILEESLKHYKEVELPRIGQRSCQDDNIRATDVPASEETQSASKPLLYEGEEAEGFYLSASSTYIYPTNYPVREYQENIVHTALFRNTLVSLPTGLGKTFIAAVVMYNYYRWYPKGKIVFMAPTRPLVAQQIRACYNIMGLPVEDTTEMTGSLNVQDRVTLWKQKRVFFLTPQVMVNDIRSKSCPAKLVKCLVVDEAHRAVKDYAYCHVVTLLEEEHSVYRLLALSATPGNDVNGVKEIIKNLKISSLEFRGEDAIDVIKYTHQKNVQSIVVNLSINIQRVKGDFLHIYDKYSKRLRECKAMNCNISTVTKFQVLKASEKFRAHPPRGMAPAAVGSIICDFSVCMSLAHALELLQIYGLRAFHSYLSEGGDKNKAAATRLRNDTDLSKILDRLTQMLSKKPTEEGYIWGHPKLYKLTTVLADHFRSAKECGEKTKAIIFCQYRVVVNEVFDVLTSLDTDIKPAMFIGQSSNSKDRGMTQAKQLEIMKNFRLGVYNCMIATCVAEEGLDIGEVDLIVLMEAHKSPIRLVQRIGRTGRKRSGKCIVMVTEGREEYKFKEAMAARKSYVASVLNAKSVKEQLCPTYPNMFPPGVKPKKQLLHIEVIEQNSPEKPAISKQVDIRACLVPEELPFISEDEYKTITTEINKKLVNFNQIPKSNFLFPRSNDKNMPIDELLKKDFTVFSEWNDWNLQLHEIHELSHSSESELMCSLLNRFYSFDVKFFNHSHVEDGESNKRKVDQAIEGEYDDEELLMSKKGKKMKKDTEKINFGMDIRQCMAAAKDKVQVKTHRDFDPNEIIDLEASNITEEKSEEQNNKLIEEVIQSLEKELNLKNSSSGPKTSCPFGENIVKSLESFSLFKRKKEVTMFTLYANLSSKKETLVSFLQSELESLKLESVEEKSDHKIKEILHPDIYWDNESIHSEKNSPTKNFVELDDLLEDQDDFKNVLKSGSKNNKSLKNLGDNCNKSPLTNSQQTVNDNIPTTPLVKDELWESLPEDLFDVKPYSTPSRSRPIISSTPINSRLVNSIKKIERKHFSQEMESPIQKTKIEDVWNLDNIFDEIEEDERKLCENPKHGEPSEATMIGITQMVSMIEREKMNKQIYQKKVVTDSLKEIKPENINNTILIEDQNSDKLLLDEDDDFFTSLPYIEEYPIKKDNFENGAHDSKNYSADMFASTIQHSKCLLDNIIPESDTIHEEEDYTMKNKIDNTIKSVSKELKHPDENLISDINDIFNDTDDEEINKTDSTNQSPHCERNDLKNTKENNISDINDILENDNCQEVITISDSEDGICENVNTLLRDVSQSNTLKKLFFEEELENESAKVVEISIKTGKEKNEFEEQSIFSIEEVIGAEVKINPPNFKRFTSNKIVRASSTHLKSQQLANQRFSGPTNKIKHMSPKKPLKCTADEAKNINEESWWFDYDFPSTYPKKETAYEKKCITNLKKSTLDNDTIKNGKNMVKTDPSKITHFIKACEKKSQEKNLVKYFTDGKTKDVNHDKGSAKQKELFSESHVLKPRNTIEETKIKLHVQSNDKINSEDKGEVKIDRKELGNIHNFNQNGKSLKNNLLHIADSNNSITNIFKNSEKCLPEEELNDDEIFQIEEDNIKKAKNPTEIVKNTLRRVNKVRSSSDHKKKRRRKEGCEFIENEAVVSDDEFSSGNDESSGLDDLEESFINDDQDNSENMHAKYLQSVKSPLQGKFKIPNKINTVDVNIYSQFEANDSEYANDSFCVDSEESSGEKELSLIEIAEKQLEKKRKLNKQNGSKLKRRRIRIISPDQTHCKEDSFESEKKSIENSLNINQLNQKKKKFRILSDSEGTASDTSPLILKKKPTSAQAKISSKKSLNFFTALSERNTMLNEDDELERAMQESQREYENYSLKKQQLEQKELEEAIARSVIEKSMSEPSTSGINRKKFLKN